MFDLEQSIAQWRRRMLAAGIKSPVPLEELENHLRDDVENLMRSGVGAREAFEAGVRQIGHTGALQTEFAKVGGTAYERWKQWICAAARIPQYQLAMNMNTPPQSLEPRWATYLKTAAFLFPALLLWIASLFLVVPKLKEICAGSHTPIPTLILTALNLSDLFRDNRIKDTLAVVLALGLLEWRSRWWARRRRLVFGVAAFLLNSIVLLVIFAMLVLALIAGPRLASFAR
jgi:hypothetical protein